MVDGRLIALGAIAACSGSHAAPSRITNHTDTTSTVAPTATADGLALVIDNAGDAPLRLRREIVVEQAVGDGWSPVGAAGLYLRERCEGAEPPACVEIAAHATFRAVAWDGMVGDAQCVCTKCGPVPAGQYRFVVAGCDDGARIETASFAVAAR